MSLVPNSVYSSPDVPVWALSGSTGGTGQAGPNLVVSTLTANSNGSINIKNVVNGGQNSITISTAPIYDSTAAVDALTITNSQFGGIYGDLFVGRVMITGQSNIGSGNAGFIDSSKISQGGLDIAASNVYMSSLQVSSINGAIPSAGQVGPAGPTGPTGPQGGDANSAFSTLTMNPTGAFTFPTTYVSTLNISSINGAVPGTGGTGAGPNLNVSTLTVNPAGAIFLPFTGGGVGGTISFGNSFTSTNQYTGLLTDYIGNASEFSDTVISVLDSKTSNFGTFQAKRIALGDKDAVGATISGGAQGLGIISVGASNVYMSSLQVSSINGAIPGTGSAPNPNLTLSTLLMNGKTGGPRVYGHVAFAYDYSTEHNNFPAGTIGICEAEINDYSGNATNAIYAGTGTTDNETVDIGCRRVILAEGTGVGAASFSPTISRQGTTIVLSPTSISTLTVSSINGARPGGGGVVGCNGVFSTMLVSSLTDTTLLIAQTAFVSTIRAQDVAVSTFSTATLTAAKGLFSTLSSINTTTSNLTANTINGFQASVSTFTSSGPMTLQQVNGSNYLWSNSTVLVASNAFPQYTGLWTGTVEINYQTSNWNFGSNTASIGASAYYNLGVRTTYGSYLGGTNQLGMLGNYTFDPISNLTTVAITLPFTSGTNNSMSPGATQNIITNLTTNNIIPLDNPPVAPTVTYTLLRLA